MMDIFHNLAAGFHVALSLQNFLYCLLGATLGTLVGVLPGLGPVTTIAMLLPLTFKLPAIGSIIMLAGIYYGAHHAGSTTAIMLNMPGEPSSVVICLDGHPMARQGRAGAALCIAALSSCFAGFVSVLIVAMFSPVLAAVAQKFGAAEYASMILLALVTISAVSSGSTLTTIAMAVLGLLLGTIGTDLATGRERFTFGVENFADGLNFVAMAVGLFAVAQIVFQLGGKEKKVTPSAKLNGLVPTRAELSASWRATVRGSVLGSLLGIFPGTGPLVASFASYALERKVATDPTRFGKGAVEGVAGPEAANNAATITHFIPMLTLGIPAGAAMALMLAALTIQGVSAGPEMMVRHADLFWGVIASMLIGNVMLLVLNLPLIGIWIKALSAPYRFVYPVILICCCVGAYSVSNSTVDVLLAAVFSVVGIVFSRINCSPAPLLLGFILEPMLEDNFRRALMLSHGDPTIFVTRPYSLAILLMTIVLLIALTAPSFYRRMAAGAERQPVGRNVSIREGEDEHDIHRNPVK